MKWPLQLDRQRQSRQRGIDRRTLARTLTCTLAAHARSFLGKQTFYFPGKFFGNPTGSIPRCRFNRLFNEVRPLVLLFSPRQCHSSLNLGMGSTLRLHLLMTWILARDGSLALFASRPAVTPAQTSFQLIRKPHGVRQILLILRTPSHITRVRAGDYAGAGSLLRAVSGGGYARADAQTHNRCNAGGRLMQSSLPF